METALLWRQTNTPGHDVAISCPFRNKMETVRYTGRQTQLEHNVSNTAPH